jgi:proline iminopeptidase
MVPTNGVDIFTRSIGFGPEVVVIHGGPSASHLSLLPAIDRLAHGRLLHYYDQRGCGDSRTSPSTPLGWQSHVDDLRELIEFWQIPKVTILGHSWGALLALLYAIQNPGRVATLLLVSPASITATGRKAYLKKLTKRITDLGILEQQRELLRSGLRERDPALFRQRAFELSLAPFLRDPKQTTGIAPFQIAHRVRESVWRSLGDFDLTGEVSTISVPTLVVHGSFDPIPLSSSQHIATLLGARLEVFERSGHLPYVEEQERFLKVADGFLPRKDGS